MLCVGNAFLISDTKMVPFRESEPLGPRMTNVLRGNANKHRILDIKNGAV